MLEIALISMYRQKDIDEIYRLVNSGDSLLLVGASGVGKSSFARALLENELFESNLGEQGLSVYLSVEEIPQLTASEVYRLLLKKLVDAVNERQLSFKVLEENEIFAPVSDFFLLEKIRALLKLILTADYRILIVVDGLERLADFLDESFFNNLKSFRDLKPFHLAYFFLSRHKIFETERAAKIEPVLRFVSANVFYLKPFDELDTKNYIRELASLRQVKLDETQTEIIKKVSGGFPSLVKLGVQYLDKNRQTSAQQLVEELLKDKSALIRLEEIYSSLSPREESLLNLISTNKKIVPGEEESLASLQKKGLLKNKNIFSELFKQFLISKNKQTPSNQPVNSKKDTELKRITLDTQTRRVYLNGREITNLTGQEFRLLEYLSQNPERICNREEVIRAVWSEGQEQGISDEAIDQLVTRLRSKIEKDKSNPQHLLTIRGRGFSFKP